MGSLEFAKLLIDRAKVAVSPGIGFGQYGDDHVRFALIENEHRTRQALRGLKNYSLSHRSDKPEPLSNKGPLRENRNLWCRDGRPGRRSDLARSEWIDESSQS